MPEKKGQSNKKASVPPETSGKRGGQSQSIAKVTASRRNGSKGGRPSKES